MPMASETNGGRAEKHSSIHTPGQEAKRSLPPSTQSQTAATLASSPQNSHRSPSPLRAWALHLCGGHPSLSTLTVRSRGRLDPSDSPPADT